MSQLRVVSRLAVLAVGVSVMIFGGMVGTAQAQCGPETATFSCSCSPVCGAIPVLCTVGPGGGCPGPVIFGDCGPTIGLSLNDRIVATPGLVAQVVMVGGLGGDRLFGGGAGDILVGGPGSDCIEGRAGADQIDGGAGVDSLHGQAGADVITAGAGNDVVLGGAGGDTISGGAGDDILTGEAGSDSVNGNGGNDLVVVADGAAGDAAIGGAGVLDICLADGGDFVDPSCEF